MPDASGANGADAGGRRRERPVRPGQSEAPSVTDGRTSASTGREESAASLARTIARGERSSLEVVDSTFERIAAVQERLNPFCFVYEEEARALARKADDAVAAGAPLPPLHGVPVAIKDFTPLAGKRTTRGSYALEHWVPDEDPVIVRRLRAAGAIVVARTTTPEFAFSSFTESPLWGITRNPWDPTRTPGGSSGGSAVAVATGCVPLAEGTDMGGSVRIPAALCGVVGMKPSLGRIPMDILPTAFDSISHFGPLARTVEDAALFLSVTQGAHDADIRSLGDSPDYRDLRPDSLQGKRIALSVDLGFYAVDADVEANTRAAAGALEGLGARVEEVHLDWSRRVVDAWFAYWGVFLAASFGDLREAHAARMDPEVLRLMAEGDRMGAVAFKRLETVFTEQWKGLAAVFERFDALVCPTMALPAPKVGKDDSDFDWEDESGRLHGLDMTCPFNNVAPCPALSVPSGFTRDGLPTGLQIVGRRHDDRGVLEIGAALEPLIGWPAWHPPWESPEARR